MRIPRTWMSVTAATTLAASATGGACTAKTNSEPTPPTAEGGAESASCALEAGGTADAFQAATDAAAPPLADPIMANSARMFDAGRRIFRYETFGDEKFWTGTLKMNAAVSKVSPKAALGVGLKVDADALPAAVVAKLKDGTLNLDDAATTLALLDLDAVVGVKGTVKDGQLESVGIRCSLCHSTVDDSFAPGIGKRLDGWANRDLDVGAIIALSPDLSAPAGVLGVPESALRQVLASWGPGKFDASVFIDGKPLRPDGKPGAVLIPPAFGLAGVNLGTYTGWGSTTYWNAFVANLEMHGDGTFFDPRLGDATDFPIAAKGGLGDVRTTPDLVTPNLAPLHFYELAIGAPKPAPNSFDVTAAGRGQALFEGKARCASCHVPPLFTEPGYNLHDASQIGIDDFQSSRSPTKKYRTTPLAGLSTHTKGGFYHDGRFATLNDVIRHYETALAFTLSSDEEHDLSEYLKSL